jgi:hypothetical protein
LSEGVKELEKETRETRIMERKTFSVTMSRSLFGAAEEVQDLELMEVTVLTWELEVRETGLVLASL